MHMQINCISLKGFKSLKLRVKHILLNLIIIKGKQLVKLNFHMNH